MVFNKSRQRSNTRRAELGAKTLEGVRGPLRFLEVARGHGHMQVVRVLTDVRGAACQHRRKDIVAQRIAQCRERRIINKLSAARGAGGLRQLNFFTERGAPSQLSSDLVLQLNLVHGLSHHGVHTGLQINLAMIGYDVGRQCNDRD